MAQLIRNSGFSTQDIVTAVKLHNLVDTAQLGPEAISSQTVMETGNIDGVDCLLGLDISSSALRKFEVGSILQAKLPCAFITAELGNPDPEELSSGVTVFGNLYSVRPAEDGLSQLPVFSVEQELVLGGNDWRLNIKENVFLLNKNSILDSSERFLFLQDNVEQLFIGRYRTSELEETGNGSIDPLPEAPVTRTAGDSFTVFSADYVDFSASTEVTVNGTLRSDTGIIYIGEKKEDPADEVTVDLTNIANGIYSVTKSVVSQSSWDSAAGDIRRSAGDVPTIGKILLDDSFVIPANEVWLVEYEGYLKDLTDNSFTICWKTAEGGVETLVSTHQFEYTDDASGVLTNFFSLDGGTDGKTIRVIIRGAVNAGSGTDSFSVFTTSSTVKGSKRITKTKV